MSSSERPRRAVRRVAAGSAAPAPSCGLCSPPPPHRAAGSAPAGMLVAIWPSRRPGLSALIPAATSHAPRHSRRPRPTRAALPSGHVEEQRGALAPRCPVGGVRPSLHGCQLHAARAPRGSPLPEMKFAEDISRFEFAERLLRRLHRADEDERHAVARPRVRADPVQPSHAVVAPRRPRERELLEVVRGRTPTLSAARTRRARTPAACARARRRRRRRSPPSRRLKRAHHRLARARDDALGGGAGLAFSESRSSSGGTGTSTITASSVGASTHEPSVRGRVDVEMHRSRCDPLVPAGMLGGVEEATPRVGRRQEHVVVAQLLVPPIEAK